LKAEAENSEADILLSGIAPENTMSMMLGMAESSHAFFTKTRFGSHFQRKCHNNHNIFITIMIQWLKLDSGLCYTTVRISGRETRMKIRRWTLSVLMISGLLTGCQSTQAMAPAVSGSVSSETAFPASSGPVPESGGAFANSSAGGASSSVPLNLTSSSSYAPPALNCVPESAAKDQSFLNGSVFIGDSVTLKLKNYVTKMRKSKPGFFGTAAFLAAGSMGSGNALQPLGKDSIHPYYNGEKALLEDSAAKMGADKIYLMLGINDLAPYGVEGAAENLEALTKRFRNKIPDVQIYIQSATPMLADKQKKTLNNPNLERYNKLVSKICEKDGWHFLDVASVMRDSTGALKSEYCSDPDDLGLHFTDAACEVWIHYILTHTGG
jgi:hypothetical protein